MIIGNYCRTWLLVGLLTLIMPRLLAAEVHGVAPGIPEPEGHNVIVQLFNWRFNDIKAVLPMLKQLGYSHVHVSPPQWSNERVWQWWGRYQPIDFSLISGPLGNELEFHQLNQEGDRLGMKILVDVVFNHTVDVRELPEPDFIVFENDHITKEKFGQFQPEDFHPRCAIDEQQPTTVRSCWLSEALADLKTENSHVRTVAKEYIQKLMSLGVDGFRFDAAKHIEPDFFREVLRAAPGLYAFGEIIESSPDRFPDVPELDWYDFPLTKTMRDAFGFGGNLTILKDAAQNKRALSGPKAVTFVRNHDIDRGQADDRGIDDSGGRSTYGVGWDESQKHLNRTDVKLAYSFLLGREDGLPYVFVDMSTLPSDQRDDTFDDPDIVAAIRFHNLCLAQPDGSGRRPEIWRIETANTIGWQRGTDRFMVINKAAEWYPITNLQTSLQSGTYKEIRNGWPMHVQANGTIHEWNVPPRSAMMFVRVGD
ncbi:MAG: alpha-amylase family glycosyl hydrolase [Nitrospira sp.]|nr:alpha-amylase family glycosyl hydrolase [Nitrospira sp.]MDH4246145.1 alpha-amylase family glycosyl hydrolase [Nitrospira sp.]MDH5320771.1 alpha-amylase family glycosyl hydrolase [Nitrospira sp.]